MWGKFINRVIFVFLIPFSFFCGFATIPFFLTVQRWGFAITQFWARSVCRAFGIKVQFFGIENVPAGGSIFGPNHLSNFDIFVVNSSPFDYRYISKIQIAYIPFIGWGMWAMGSYFVRRDKSEKDKRVMEKITRDLQKDDTKLLIFMEGTRSRSGQLGPFKKGAFVLAQKTQVPLIPVAIKGTYEIAPPGRLLPIKWGHKVTVRFGKPMMVPTDVPVLETMEIFRNKVKDLLNAGNTISN